jgi:hypothetical protein
MRRGTTSNGWGCGSFVTVTKLAEARCQWCQRPFDPRPGPGRPSRYCRRSCRQREYEARRRAAERGLDEGEIVVARSRIDELQDRLWVLSCAIDDVDGDLARAQDLDAYKAALEWLLDAARPVVADLGK